MPELDSNKNIMKTIVLSIFLLPLSLLAKQYESYYQDLFADKIGGRTEVVANDNTRCDILTSEYAIEVDFARKWAEAIGQSLNYGKEFDRKSGILLILEKPSDKKHLNRIHKIINSYELPITVWEIDAETSVELNTTKEAMAPNSVEPSMDSVTPTGIRESDASAEPVGYWISSTGKTHNHGCRYYGKGNGEHRVISSDINCKICGGAEQAIK